jgi:hypothetical protein
MPPPARTRRTPSAAAALPDHRGRIAANDDAPSIGGLIYALNQKPNKPFFYAGVASGICSIGLGLPGCWSVPTCSARASAISTRSG